MSKLYDELEALCLDRDEWIKAYGNVEAEMTQLKNENELLRDHLRDLQRSVDYLEAAVYRLELTQP